MTPTDRERSTVLATARAAARGTRPPRYDGDFWNGPFRERVERQLRPGMSILDVGAGAHPTIETERRPTGCTYVGLDVAEAELAKAETGAYDARVVGDIVDYRPELSESFDLVVSWFVLEHVKPIDLAIENMRRYLKPGGQMISQLAGGRSPSGLANRAIPHRLAKLLLQRLLKEDPERVFPAHYDRCWSSALVQMLGDGWTDSEVLPLHTGVEYVRFSRFLMGLFVGYEEWAYRTERNDLATYYLIAASRSEP